jgi:hypothetical protein
MELSNILRRLKNDLWMVLHHMDRDLFVNDMKS